MQFIILRVIAKIPKAAVDQFKLPSNLLRVDNMPHQALLAHNKTKYVKCVLCCFTIS